MTDYKERFERWQKEAKERFEEIDKQIGLTDKIGEGAKIVSDTAQKGAEALKDGAQKIKAEAEKSDVGKQAVNVAESAYKTAGDAAKKVYEASEPLRDAAEDAGGKAADAVKEAGKKAGEAVSYAGEKAGDVIGETYKNGQQDRRIRVACLQRRRELVTHLRFGLENASANRRLDIGEAAAGGDHGRFGRGQAGLGVVFHRDQLALVVQFRQSRRGPSRNSANSSTNISTRSSC
ncbi:MAG: hypothetical protein IPJ30_09990 [Acidobacteria bacterium]|nr:hypothetical protein [Acidobacteriota bacterium]